MNQKIGYLRFSTDDQTGNLQLDALRREGCDRIFSDESRGRERQLPELEKALAALNPGDTLVVWKFDRLGAGMSAFVKIAERINKSGAQIKSLTEGCDTSTPIGELFFVIIGWLSKMELESIRTRTEAGLAAARARGRTGGRPAGIPKAKRALAESAVALFKQGWTVQRVCDDLKIPRSTFMSWKRLILADKPK